MSYHKAIKRTNDFVIKFANVNGSGSASANELFARAIMSMGVPTAPRNIFPSNIQGMPTWYEMRVCAAGWRGRRGGCDMIVAMNPQTWERDVADLAPGGYLFYDSTKALPASRFRDDVTVLGLPLAKMALGDAAVPSVALVLIFNALILWTLVTVSIEWAKHGSLSVKGFAKTVRGVLTNPIVAGILLGSLFGLTRWPLPQAIDIPLGMISQAAAPMALIALGMGLAEYGIRSGLKISLSICAVKLLIQPLVVWGLAVLLGLPTMETQVIVLLASIAVGANVYLMSRQFKSLEGPVASSLVLSTGLAALTTPLLMTLVGAR